MNAATVGVLFVTLCCVSGTARADPIVITAGVVGETNGNDLPGFQLTGANSSFAGILPIAGVLCCVFNAGDTVTLSRPFAFGNLPGVPNQETVNGVTYSAAFITGGLDFAAVPFVAPTLNGSSSFVFTTPFTASGTISGYADASLTQLLFSVPLTGSGTASVFGSEHASVPNYIGQGVAFSFESAAATPEPGSAILLVLGAVGVLLWRWRLPRRA